jgi:sugar phosphate isomerase/epimerase
VFTVHSGIMQRRKFLNSLCLGTTAISSLNFNKVYNSFLNDFPYKLSLAQFSLFRLEMNRQIDPMDFAKIASNLGFKGLEYLQMSYTGGLLNDKQTISLSSIKKLANDLNQRANDNNMENVLIMIDIGPDLAKEINETLDPYYIWIDCASEMSCHSVRVNLRGSDDNLIAWTNNSIQNLNKLCDYANPLGVNIIVENHGGYSSNADYLLNVIDSVDYNNIGTLPDFGNFCIRQDQNKTAELFRLFREGSLSKDPPTIYDSCVEDYDMYEGVAKLMKNALGVSAKTHGFDANGNDVDIDYEKMMKIVKDSNYDGFIGVEAQVFNMNPIDAINASKKLLLNSYI